MTKNTKPEGFGRGDRRSAVVGERGGVAGGEGAPGKKVVERGKK